MQVLEKSFFASDINFNAQRVTLNKDEINIVNGKKEGFASRIYRFLTFKKNEQLVAVNRKLAGLEKNAAFIDSIVKGIKEGGEGAKGHFFYNIYMLNQKFIKGNQVNSFSALILKVVSFVAKYFGWVPYVYQELNIEELKKQIEPKLAGIKIPPPAGHGTTSPTPTIPPVVKPTTSLALSFSKATFPIPLPLVPLLSGSEALAPYQKVQEIATVSQLWNQLAPTQQQAVMRLFKKGELMFDQHFFNMLLPQGDKIQMGVKSQGDVTILLEESDIKALQMALTGTDDWQGRLLTCMLLAGVGEQAIPLLDWVKENNPSLEGVVQLLLTWQGKGEEPKTDPEIPQQEPSGGSGTETETKPKKPERPPSLLDRISDLGNPPRLSIEGKNFTVGFDTKKSEFVIKNFSDAAFKLTCIGAIIQGQFCSAFKPIPITLVNREDTTARNKVICVTVPCNTVYQLEYGKSAFTISYESLSDQ